MDSIIEYAEQELAQADEKPVNAVDSLLLSQLSYLRLGEAFPACATERGMALRDLFRAESFDTLYRGQRDEEQNYRLLAALAASPRFRDVTVCDYVNVIDEEKQEQFSASTFVLPGDDAFVVFRGTDSTFIGWKENLNMSCSFPVPSQVDAAAYLDEQAGKHTGALYVGGHSKGGNLAEYAGFKCERQTQDRIKAVFDHDGPGFAVDVFSAPAFKRVAARIFKTVPQKSIVGMLFDSIEDYRIVVSNGIGVMQHDPFTWSVDIDASDFCLSDHLALSAQRNDEVLSGWINSQDKNHRQTFSDSLFDTLTKDGSTQFTNSNVLADPATLAALGSLFTGDAATRDSVMDTISSLVKFAVTPTPAPSCKETGVGQDVPEEWKKAKLPDGRPFMMSAADYLEQVKSGMTKGRGAQTPSGEKGDSGDEGRIRHPHVIAMPPVGSSDEKGEQGDHGDES